MLEVFEGMVHFQKDQHPFLFLLALSLRNVKALYQETYIHFFCGRRLAKTNKCLAWYCRNEKWMILSKQFIKRKANEKIIVPQIRVNSLLSFRWNFNFAPIFEQHNWRKNLTPKMHSFERARSAVIFRRIWFEILFFNVFSEPRNSGTISKK